MVHTVLTWKHGLFLLKSLCRYNVERTLALYIVATESMVIRASGGARHGDRADCYEAFYGWAEGDGFRISIDGYYNLDG